MREDIQKKKMPFFSLKGLSIIKAQDTAVGVFSYFIGTLRINLVISYKKNSLANTQLTNFQF